MLQMEFRSLSTFLVLLAALVSVSHAQQCSPSSCATSAKFAFDATDHSTSDYFYLGGLFSVHEQGLTSYQCGQLRKNGVQQLEAFLWAVRTFNQRHTDVLTKVNIGSFAFDSCQSTDILMQHLLNLETCTVAYGNPVVSPDRVLAFIGLETAAEAEKVVPVLESMERTIVSPLLSGADVHPNMTYLLKVFPSKTEEVNVLASLVKKREYKFVNVIYGNQDNDEENFALLKEKLEQVGSCVVFSKQIPLRSNQDYFSQMDALMGDLHAAKSARAVIILANTGDTYEILLAAKRNGMRGRFTWIATSSWGTIDNVVQGQIVVYFLNLMFGFYNMF